MNAESIILSSEPSTSALFKNDESIGNDEQNYGKQTFDVTLQNTISEKQNAAALTVSSNNGGVANVFDDLVKNTKYDNSPAVTILPVDGENSVITADLSGSLNPIAPIILSLSDMNTSESDNLQVKNITRDSNIFAQSTASGVNNLDQGRYIPINTVGILDPNTLSRDNILPLASQMSSVHSFATPESQQGVLSADFALDKRLSANIVVSNVGTIGQRVDSNESLELNSKAMIKEMFGAKPADDKNQDPRPLDVRTGLQQPTDVLNRQGSLGLVNFYSQIQRGSNKEFSSVDSAIESSFLSPWDKKTSSITGAKLETNQIYNRTDLEGLYSLSGQQSIASQTLPKSFFEISGAMSSPRWGEELNGKLHVLLQSNLQQAQFQINPRNLGTLEVHITVGQDQQVSIGFNVNSASAKEALDMAMPRLREMLLEQGLNLSNVDVGQRSANQHKSDQQNAAFSGADLEVFDNQNDANNMDERKSIDYLSGDSSQTLDIFV